ncbi:hypothetical protein BD324DRAFT_653224 [Kockovaella imperatae]|uniref:REJ domain-containing protein n=1 Tax=Kockovaella imperatae TaxID=4999 RepID=A0A1Y1UAA4_9TREE|nr:hypothetical protein BD324DRAFT_653224 [Kockovaella imperatae]ORX34447.1 hypothetical protein BD324DRAFT_653224 [Kockovaella imperatae]
MSSSAHGLLSFLGLDDDNDRRDQPFDSNSSTSPDNSPSSAPADGVGAIVSSVVPTTQPQPTTDPATTSAAPTQDLTTAPTTSPSPTPSPEPTTQTPASEPATISKATPTQDSKPTTSPPPESQQQTTQESASPAPETSTQQQQQQQQQTQPQSTQTSTQAAASDANEASPNPTTSVAATSSSATSAPAANNAPTTISVATTGRVQTQTSTDANGRVWTVTVPVRNGATDGASTESDDTTSGFFGNTGAVAGVFVVLGLLVAGVALAIAIILYRRKRSQRLDREVDFVASNRSHRDDDEKSTGARSTFMDGPYIGDLHQAPAQSAGTYAFDDPSGGYDSYALNLPSQNALGGGDRMSTVTNAGMAGFGAQSAAAAYNTTYPAQPEPTLNYAASGEGYEELNSPVDGTFRSGSRTGYAVTTDSQPPANQGYYFDPRQADEFHEDQDEILQYPQRAHRPDSSGSVVRDLVNDRGLTVTNV